MPIGSGGKYDRECEYVRQLLRSRGVLLIVLDGPKGPGFSAQGTPEILAGVPEVLRITADSIEKDLRPQSGGH